MSKLLGNALASARRAKGLTQKQVGDAVKVSRAAVAQWEKGLTEPSLHNLLTACQLLDLNVTAATAGMVQFQELEPLKPGQPHKLVLDRRPTFRDEEEFFESISGNKRLGSPNPIPVRSVGLNANLRAGEFVISPEIIDFVARPPGIHKLAEVFAIHSPTEALSPRFEIGDILFLSSSKPARAGDDVVLEFGALDDDSGGKRGILRRLISQTDTAIEVRAFTPDNTHMVGRADVSLIHRVLPISELLSI